MICKDTTLLLCAPEDRRETDDVFPEILVIKSRRSRIALPRPVQQEPAFRLRLMLLIGVASLALVTIVLISQQLIVRHLSGQETLLLPGKTERILLELDLSTHTFQTQDDVVLSSGTEGEIETAVAVEEEMDTLQEEEDKMGLIEDDEEEENDDDEEEEDDLTGLVAEDEEEDEDLNLDTTVMEIEINRLNA